MLFLPVTRSTNIERVVDAFDKSDIPKRLILLVDAPDVGPMWVNAFYTRGWAMEVYDVSEDTPPVARLERRSRHFKMRQMSQLLVRRRDERILFSEDDTLVPHDVWSRLNAVMDSGFKAASGVQIDRHGSGLAGIWRYDESIECFDPAYPTRDSGVIQADAVGHFCLLTDGQTYADTPILNAETPIDRQHTFGMRPIGVDTNVWCGHLLDDGSVIE